MSVEYPARLFLANLPTRIEKLDTLSRSLGGPDIWMKRDDLTGCAVSGNKIRKLEFSIADALKNKADTIITCGWLNSNHARATAIISAKMNLKSILLLQGEEPSEFQGNIFLNKLAGAEIRYLSASAYERRNEIMCDIEEELKREDKKGYSIPAGATNSIGIWGYINAAREIKNQTPDFDRIIVPVGTGGTYAGLFIGKKLFDLKAVISGVNVEEDKEYFIDRIVEIIEEWNRKFNNPINYSQNEIEIIDGYQGKGYSKFGKEEVEVIKRLARSEGIILDPVYTGKAMRGLIGEVENGNFDSKERILFIHTGGIFGLLSRTIEFGKF
jgi:D-cysteine desulfhydrase